MFEVKGVHCNLIVNPDHIVSMSTNKTKCFLTLNAKSEGENDSYELSLEEYKRVKALLIEKGYIPR